MQPYGRAMRGTGFGPGSFCAHDRELLGCVLAFAPRRRQLVAEDKELHQAAPSSGRPGRGSASAPRRSATSTRAQPARDRRSRTTRRRSTRSTAKMAKLRSAQPARGPHAHPADQLNDRNREAYIQGPGAPFLYLLTATSAAEAASRLSLLTEMNRRDELLAYRVQQTANVSAGPGRAPAPAATPASSRSSSSRWTGWRCGTSFGSPSACSRACRRTRRRCSRSSQSSTRSPSAR